VDQQGEPLVRPLQGTGFAFQDLVDLQVDGARGAVLAAQLEHLVVIPAALLDQIVPEAAEQEQLEEWIMGEIGKGVPLVGGDYIALWVARVLTVIFFLFFQLMPWYTATDREKAEPQRVTW
jgi:hypothetical protein